MPTPYVPSSSRVVSLIDLASGPRSEMQLIDKCAQRDRTEHPHPHLQTLMTFKSPDNIINQHAWTFNNLKSIFGVGVGVGEPRVVPFAPFFSNEDPAKSGLESNRISNLEGGFSQCTVEFLSAAFSEFRLKGSWFVGSRYVNMVVKNAPPSALPAAYKHDIHIYIYICIYVHNYT